MKEHYEIEGDNRKFDNVLEAVNAAADASIARGGIKVKVQRAVLYTGNTEYEKYTLAIIEMPSVDMIRGASHMADPTLQPLPQSTPVLSNNPPLTVSEAFNVSHPLSSTFKPCYNCGRK